MKTSPLGIIAALAGFAVNAPPADAPRRVASPARLRRIIGTVRLVEGGGCDWYNKSQRRRRKHAAWRRSGGGA